MKAGEPALTENALVVLRNRYLAKNGEGQVVEDPDQMFRRVARNLVLVDILYASDVYDPEGEQARTADRPGLPRTAIESMGKPDSARRLGPYTGFDLATLARAYDSLACRGHMKVSWEKLLELLKERGDDLKSREDELHRSMASLELLFNSPTLMNAGRELQQLSACFVLPVDDSLEGIFDTLKHTALIHQSGGGCVAGSALVHTTFCGLEAIGTLYERVRNLGITEDQGERHRVMDVSALGIKTMALDPKTGAFAPRPVTHLWRWDVPSDEQIAVRCQDGTEITTSRWHPFMAFDGKRVVERRADELRPGDVLVQPNRTVRENWPVRQYRKVEGFVLDEKLAWLAGYYLGDGSSGWFSNRTTGYHALRLRFFDGRTDCLEFASSVLRGLGVDVAIQREARGLFSLSTTNSKFTEPFLRLVQAGTGPKDELTLPSDISKSPLTVVAAFLGGLIDADGYVSLSRRRVVYSTVCPILARRLQGLLSLLGFSPAVLIKPPKGRATRTLYDVKLAVATKTHELADLVLPWVHDPLRRQRLELLREPSGHNTHARLPVGFDAVEDLLGAAGVRTKTTAIHRAPVELGGEKLWLHRTKWGGGINETKLAQLVRTLRRVLPEAYSARLDLLERVADGCTMVEKVGPAAGPEAFYDFTVETANNYLAGAGSLGVIHNTGFSFSRLRPKDDIVKSTGGVASGPVSFMQVFDSATNAIKQGGTRRGANMGILRCDHPDILQFIDCKVESDAVTNFNISVALTDAFMKAVREDKDYELLNPRSGKPVGKLRAREVFELIARRAWANGEPGVVFIDRINAANPTPHVGTIESTNPCVVGDALVRTADGLIRMDRLVAEASTCDIRIATDDRVLQLTLGRNGTTGGAVAYADHGVTFHPVARAFASGVKPVVRVATAAGHSIEVTRDHKMMTTLGWVPAGKLRPGYHSVLMQSGEGGLPTDKVSSVTPVGEKPVFDLQEPFTHSFVANGFVVSNCGEQPLLPYESCNLGSLNLALFVGDGKIDFDRLGATVDLAVHYLDNVIDANLYPMDEIERMTKGNRKIGLGVMGWADMLIQLGVAYDSEEAISLAGEVMGLIDERSKKASAALARTRGAFPNFRGSVLDKAGKPPLRNATTTTIAPTGTISIVAGASGGIEPLFSLAFTRKGILGGEELVETNPYFEAAARSGGYHSDALLAKIAEVGTVAGLEEVPAGAKRLFVTALDIAPSWHIRMQAAFQAHTDNAVSKTVNLPFEAKPEDIKAIYEMAYDQGCKGVTVYRNGSRSEQVLNVGKSDRADRAEESQDQKAPGSPGVTVDRGPWGKVKPLPRPEGLAGVTVRKVTPLGNLYLTLNTSEGQPFELFAQLGKAGSDLAAFTEAIARLISLALRCGIDPQEVAGELGGIGGHRSVGFGPNRIKSVPDAIARFLDDYLAGTVEVSPWMARQAGQLIMFENGAAKNGDTGNGNGGGVGDGAASHEGADAEPAEAPGTSVPQAEVMRPNGSRRSYDLCPSCGMHSLAYEEGCLKCRSCGYSEC